MDRRQFLQAAGATTALATIPGLSGIFKERSSFQPADTSVAGHITIAFYGAADIIKAWDVVFADFRKVYPNITVDAVAIPAATWTAYADSAILQMAGGRSLRLAGGRQRPAPLSDQGCRDPARPVHTARSRRVHLLPRERGPPVPKMGEVTSFERWADLFPSGRLQRLVLLGQH